MPDLRVIDAGDAAPLRSQALWHGLADAMTPEAPATLSFCRPAAPYVGTGCHRPLDEIDLARCAELGLPVIRRRIGGGPVYLDPDQLFFQITLPAGRAPARVDRLYAEMLAPAVAAFRALGANARIRGLNDIAAGDRRLSGTGAGRIGDGVTVVGNVIFRFPHRRMAEILALPEEATRRECLRLMRRHVGSLFGEGIVAGPAEARRALVEAYAAGLGLAPAAAALSTAEREAVAHWERKLADPEWLAGTPRTAARSGVRIKICAGVWLWAAREPGPALAYEPGAAVRVSIVDGVIQTAALDAAELNGARAAAERALAGAPAKADEVRRRLAPFGAAGRRLADLIEPGTTSEEGR